MDADDFEVVSNKERRRLHAVLYAIWSEGEGKIVGKLLVRYLRMMRLVQ